MDYENKYKEALERMKSWARGEHPECFAEAQKAAEFIFPELAESEDERIRKLCEILVRTCFMNELCTKEDKDDCIAWLEKQNSQILSNSAKTGKDESKFREGDWIISNDKKSIYQVIEVKRGIYVIRDNADNHEHHIGIEECEKSGRFWNISDAKDGDVLYSQKHNLIWIYKDNKHYYASINLNYADGISFDGDIVIPSDVCPANRVQRSILLQKTEETGYEWSDKDRKLISKKELKKVENVYEPDAFIEESYQQQADDLIDMVTEKSTWSEEDWNYIADLISYFDGSSLQHDTPDVISWLKSFKPQNMWEPSDEQMKALRDLNLTGNISYAGQGQTLIELYNDLKKLKEE